jgi:hypothetical protein
MSENSTTMFIVAPNMMQAQHAGEEREGECDADEDRGAAAEDEQDDHDDQQDRRRHAVLQVAEHVLDEHRLVADELNPDARRPRFLRVSDRLLHRRRRSR